MDLLSFSDVFEMKAATQSRQMIQVRLCIILELHGNIGAFIKASLYSPRITYIYSFSIISSYSD